MKKLLASLLVASTISFGANANTENEFNIERSNELAECYVLHAIWRNKVTDLSLRFKQKAYDLGSFVTVDARINLFTLSILANQKETGELLIQYTAKNFDLDKCFSLLNK